MKFFTADPHFGNENIIEYCNRPFKNAVEMDKQIIKKFNEIVSDKDDLFILGDFSLKDPRYFHYYSELFRRLNGNIHIIAGNHEELKFYNYIKAGAKSFHFPYLELEEFILVHDPVLSIVDRKRIFLVGHAHDNFITQKNAINVGVDVHNFKPLSIDQVREIAKGLEL